MSRGARTFGRAWGAALAAAALACAPHAGAATKKFALSMMHFNIQYVAGGLVGYFATPNPTLDLDAEEVEDRIVTQSFAPTLDVFDAHPTWGGDLELQGYMLDVLAARHPAVLDHLRALAKTGRVEVVSFHYSDQLFMAYSREDWARSQALTRATFDKYDVPLSTAVFCQEGQSGPGMAAAMKATGYSTLVWPKNLLSYQHGDGAPTAPLYQLGDVDMVTSNGLSFDDGTNQIDVSWWFVDDGELFATGGIDPYLPEQYVTKPAKIAAKVADLEALETQGYAITTVTDYVTQVKGLVAKADPPPLLDGTWQPSSTDGIRRWLGGFGLWWIDERDNDVRTLGAAAHRELVAAGAAAKAAGIDAAEEIDAGFRLLALGQVTDASGINPFRGEVEYGIAHQAEALRIARDVIERAKDKLGAAVVAIDPATGEVTPGEHAPPAPPTEAALLSPIIEAGDRAVTTTWRRVAEDEHELTIHFGRGDERSLSVKFPGEQGDIVYTPGLAEAPVHVPRDAFTFDHFELALSDGLIGLGASRFVVADQTRVHVAAEIVRTGGDVLFHDETTPQGEETTWVFRVVEGDEMRAEKLAHALNATAKVWR